MSSSSSPFRRIAEAEAAEPAENPILRILCVPVFVLVLAPDPRSPNQAVPYVSRHLR